MIIKSFTVLGPVVAKQRPKFARRGNFTTTYTLEKTTNYENLVKLTYQNEHGNFMFDKETALKVTITIVRELPKSFSNKKRELAINGFIRPITRGDVDNYAKTILDALNGIAYHDDAQVTDLEVFKRFDYKSYAEITISSVGGNE